MKEKRKYDTVPRPCLLNFKQHVKDINNMFFIFSQKVQCSLTSTKKSKDADSIFIVTQKVECVRDAKELKYS